MIDEDVGEDIIVGCQLRCRQAGLLGGGLQSTDCLLRWPAHDHRCDRDNSRQDMRKIDSEKRLGVTGADVKRRGGTVSLSGEAEFAYWAERKVLKELGRH